MVLPDTERTKQANQKLDVISQREQDLSTKEAEVSQREVEHRSRELDLREAQLKAKEDESKKAKKEEDESKKAAKAKADIHGKTKATDLVFKRDGKYIGERRKIHERILNDIVGGVKPIPPPEGHKPVAIFTAGGPGSGKSSMVKAAHEKFGTEMAQIAADEVKKEIPEYSKELSRGNEDAAILVHEESTDIAAEAIQRCIDSGKPFMLDSTFKNVPKFQKMIKELKDKGYDIHVLYAHCPEDEAVRRAKQRQEDTGRKVDEKVVREGNHQAKQALYELGGLVDTTSVFDTTAKGAPPPELMFHHAASKKEDFGRVRDIVKGEEVKGEKKLYDRFLDEIKSGKYEIEHDDDNSEIPFGERLKYDDGDGA